ncbi:22622_t:CDS:2, partial [Gigaspora margarita]
MIAEINQDNIQEIWRITDKWPGNNQRQHFCRYSQFPICAHACLILLFSSNVSVEICRISYWNDSITSISTNHSTSNRCAEIRRSKYAFIDKKKRSTINKESETSSIESDVNPPVTKHRGKPASKRFNAATEKPRRQPYTCRKCGKTG